MNSVHQMQKLEISQFIDISKAAGIDEIWGKFLKDGPNILVKPTAEIYNISIPSRLFPSDCKITKLKSLYKKGPKSILKVLNAFLSYN